VAAAGGRGRDAGMERARASTREAARGDQCETLGPGLAVPGSPCHGPARPPRRPSGHGVNATAVPFDDPVGSRMRRGQAAPACGWQRDGAQGGEPWCCAVVPRALGQIRGTAGLTGRREASRRRGCPVRGRAGTARRHQRHQRGRRRARLQSGGVGTRAVGSGCHIRGLLLAGVDPTRRAHEPRLTPGPPRRRLPAAPAHVSVGWSGSTASGRRVAPCRRPGNR
jgi:hypothetical protein